MFSTAQWVQASPFRAWAFATVAFAVSLATRFASDHLLPVGFPYLTFFPAVILTTFFAGLRPGIASAILCGLAAWYWFIPPFETFGLSGSTLIALTFYAGVVAVDILLIKVMHRSVEDLQTERSRTEALLLRQETLLEDQRNRERQQRMLQRELSHRMKNTLAMVQAVVSQSLRNVSDPKEAAELASARIQALARAQDALTATDWAAADVSTIVRTSIAPHLDGGHRFVVDGPEVELDAQRALGLALALHELATNATKYGALSNDIGTVRITWNVSGKDDFRFAWMESGGPQVVSPTRRGFGSRLTEKVVPSYFEGRAKIEYAQTGLAYVLDGSLSVGVPSKQESEA